MKKSLTNLIGIGVLAGIVALGSTLAASINLNNGGPVEFGQGVTQAISNAVRHGRAKNVEIVIKRYRHSKTALHLIISNDGQPLPDLRELGLGFKNLDATTSDWKISNTKSGLVCVEAII